MMSLQRLTLASLRNLSHLLSSVACSIQIWRGKDSEILSCAVTSVDTGGGGGGGGGGVPNKGSQKPCM